MFRTLKYSINQAFDSLEISVMFQLKKDSSIITESKFFINSAAGRDYFIKLRKNYLTQKLEYYILHKRHIIEGGKQYPGIETKKKSLENCFNFLKWSVCEERLDLKEIELGLNKLQLVCKYCLTISKDLEAILPGEKNPSYQNSRNDLSEILTFCKNQLHFEESIKKAC